MDFDDDDQMQDDVNNYIDYPSDMLGVYPNNIYYYKHIQWLHNNAAHAYGSKNSIPSRNSRKQLESERTIERKKDLALYGRVYVRKRDNANKMFAGLGLGSFIENYGIVAICAVVFFLLFTPI